MLVPGKIAAEETIRNALADSQYLAGAQAGWNAAHDTNPEAALASLLKSRDGHLAGFAEAKAVLSAPPKVAGDAEEMAKQLEEWGSHSIALPHAAAAHLRATANLAVEIEALRTKAAQDETDMETAIDQIAVLGMDWRARAQAAEKAVETLQGEIYDLKVINNGFRNDYLDAEASRLAAERKLEAAVGTLQAIEAMGPVTCEMTLAHDMADTARTFLAAMNTGADDAEG